MPWFHAFERGESLLDLLNESIEQAEEVLREVDRADPHQRINNIHNGAEPMPTHEYVCQACHRPLPNPEDRIIVRDRNWTVTLCRACVITCDHCGRVTYRGWVSQYHGESWCDECTRYLSRCAMCGEFVDADEGESNGAGSVCCHTCINRMNLRVCDSCGQWQRIGHGVIRDDGVFICHRCRPRSLHCYHDGAVDITYHGAGRLDVVPFYGIEMETDDYNEQDCIDLADTFIKYSENETVFHMETDGSLDNGIEFIFQPRTYKSWQDFKPTLVKITDMVKAAGGSYTGINEEETCGCHIHRSRTGLSDVDICKLVAFMVRFKNQCVDIAQRHNDEHASYRFTSQICPLGERNGSLKYVFKERSALRRDRYVALNLSNPDTVEFRLFRGSLEPDTIMAYLEFCESLVNFCQNTSIVSIITHTKTSVWSKYLDSTLGYKHLRKHMARVGLLPRQVKKSRIKRAA